MSEREIATQLTEFLVKPERGSYGQPDKSPLAKYVETEITAICRKVAAEVVAAYPEVAESIRQRTVHVILAALEEDSYLNEKVTKAVAEQITSIALERRDEE